MRPYRGVLLAVFLLALGTLQEVTAADISSPSASGLTPGSASGSTSGSGSGSTSGSGSGSTSGSASGSTSGPGSGSTSGSASGLTPGSASGLTPGSASGSTSGSGSGPSLPADATIGFEETTYTAMEEDGSVEVVVAVLQGNLSCSLVVRLETVDGTARSTDDYSSLNITLTFDTSVWQQAVQISIADDTVDEDRESFLSRLRLALESIDVPVLLNPNETEILIIDDDGVTIGLKNTTYSIGEVDGSMEVCAVLLEGSLERVVGVNLSTSDGSATDGEDYTGVQVILTFDQSTPRACAEISVTDDDRFEGVENFTVTLQTPDPDVTLVSNEGTVFVRDNDGVTIGFEEEEYSANEGDGDVGVCAILQSGVLERTVEVSLITEEDTASAGEDYQDPGTVQLSVSEGTIRACTQIQLEDDSLLELEEQFRAILSSTEDGVTVSPSTATIRIFDNDVATIGFEETTYTAMEEDGSVEVVVAVLQGNLSSSVVVRLETVDGTARSPDDYTALNTTLTFDSSVRQQTMQISVEDDTVDEDRESFLSRLRLALENIGLPVQINHNEAEILIIDNDGVAIGLENMTYSIGEEDGSVEVCAVLLGGSLERVVGVTLSNSDDSATDGEDYTGVQVILTFDQSTSRACAEISVTDDDRFEGMENFTATLQTPDPDVTLVPNEGTVFVRDNDDATVSFEMMAYTFGEGYGTVSVCSEITVPAGGLECDLVVTFSTTDGANLKAVSGEDYNISVDFAATFISGNTSSGDTACADISIIDDDALEGDHDFTVSLDSTTPPATISTPSSVIVTIQDNEGATVEMVHSVVQGSEEEGSVNICVKIDAGPPGGLECDVVATLSTDNSMVAVSGDDFTAPVPPEVTFAAGRTENGDVECINFILEDDEALEGDHVFTVVINSTTPEEVSIRPESSTTMVITGDNEVLLVSMQEASLQVAENSSSVDVCVQISGAADGLEIEVVATLITMGSDKAVLGEDFIPPTPLEVTFTAGSPDNSIECVAIQVVDDSALEGSHSFTVRLQSTSPGVSSGVQINAVSSTTVITIQDNEVSREPSEQLSTGERAGIGIGVTLAVIIIIVIIVAIIFIITVKWNRHRKTTFPLGENVYEMEAAVMSITFKDPAETTDPAVDTSGGEKPSQTV